MPSSLRDVLARLWAWCRPRGPLALKPAREGNTRPPDARARFWNEFREGQREADARASRSR